MALVYVATSPSGKKYIGKTIESFAKRKSCHLWHADNGSSFPFHKALRKYGDAIAWEVYKSELSEDEANIIEKNLIIDFNTFGGDGYNCTNGGDGSSGFVHTKKTKDSMSKNRKGIKFSEERNKKISKSLTGKKRPQKVKDKVSNSLKGNKVWHDGKEHDKYKNNSSGYTGVSKKTKNRYCAQITFSGRRIYLGLFEKARDAAMAYNVSAKKCFGKFANLNKIEPEEFKGAHIE